MRTFRLDLNTGRYYNVQTLQLMPLGFHLEANDCVLIGGQTLTALPEQSMAIPIQQIPSMIQPRRPTLRHGGLLSLAPIPENIPFEVIPHEFSPLTPDSPPSPMQQNRAHTMNSLLAFKRKMQEGKKW